MASVSLEERVATLEAEVARLKQRDAQAAVPWWEQRFGAFRDDPMYEAAMRLGAEYRKSQSPPSDDDVPA
jgi:hypothetical protein